MTRAPMSASSMVQKGMAMTCPRSITVTSFRAWSMELLSGSDDLLRAEAGDLRGEAELRQHLLGVRAERRRGGPEPTRRGPELPGKARHPHGAMPGMLDLEHHLLRQHLRIAEHGAEVSDPSARHPRGVQMLDPVRDGARADALADERVDGVAMAQPRGVAREL